MSPAAEAGAPSRLAVLPRGPAADVHRRRLLIGAALAALFGDAAGSTGTGTGTAERRQKADADDDAAAVARSQHFPFGPVLPARPLKPYAVRTHLGTSTDLATLLRGRTTALQLMFTGCSATCPIQGALFAQAQQQLAARQVAAAQFVSLSIDPLSDSPAALAAWLRGFGARPGWLAAAPRVEDVDAIVALLGSGGEPRPAGSRDPHTGQVYLIDSRGGLVLRLPSMPPPARIVAALEAVSRRG